MIPSDFVQITEAFRDATDAAVRVVNHETVARNWAGRSALDGFTVGGLVSHLYAATRRTEIVLDEPVLEEGTSLGLSEFYGANRVNRPDDLAEGPHLLIREDGERRAKQGYEAVTRRFQELVTRLNERLPNESPELRVPVLLVAGGVTSLGTYVVTRIIELVVHGDDIASSVDLPAPQISSQTGSLVLGALVEIARARCSDLEMIRAFTRRERVDPDALRVL
jgi:hypothetical protein